MAPEVPMRSAHGTVAGAVLGLLVLGGCATGTKEEAMAVEVGKAAPTFRLNDHTGKLTTVGGTSKTWTVLAFYPKAMTGGCTKEVCSLRDAANDFRALGVQAYGISMDDTTACAEFVKQQNLNFPLLSDPDGSAVSKYGAGADGKPYSARITYVIDPEGVLRHVDKSVNVATHGADLVALVKKLKGA
jgi:peroxiredoxin Q/BCP